MLWLKAFALWCAIVVIAILNGILREQVLAPALEPAGALVASGIVLSACIVLMASAAAPWLGRRPGAQWWRVGVFWLALTLGFEFAFGRLVLHKSWSDLLQAYTFAGGNLWPAVLAVTLVAPRLAAQWRGLVGPSPYA